MTCSKTLIQLCTMNPSISEGILLDCQWVSFMLCNYMQESSQFTVLVSLYNCPSCIRESIPNEFLKNDQLIGHLRPYVIHVMPLPLVIKGDKVF